MNRSARFVLLFLLFGGDILQAVDSIKLKITIEVRNGTGDNPMIVAWLENKNNGFIQTLHMFSKDRKYYKDMPVWFGKSKSKGESRKEVDAVSGATVKWNQTKSAVFEIGVASFKNKGCNIRIESRKDKGGHYKSFAIPLDEALDGGTFEHNGYVKKVTFSTGT